MTVQELNTNQFSELRESLYWKLLDEGKIDIDTFDGVTDEQVIEEYDGINFVEEDFFCGNKEDK